MIVHDGPSCVDYQFNVGADTAQDAPTDLTAWQRRDL